MDRIPLARRFVTTVIAIALVASSFVIARSTAATAATAGTPVMGTSIMNADQLAHWFSAKRVGAAQPRIPALNNDVHALAQIFLDEGAREGVRGDIAFVQSVIETGWFVFDDNGQIRPDFNNFAGLNANNGRRIGTTCADEVLDAPLASRCFPTPQIGVRAQIQLLRGYADPSSRNLPDRLRMPPSDRIGLAPWWEYFGGNSATGKLIWASAPDYGIRILKLYSGALMFNGLPPLAPYPDVTLPTGAVVNPVLGASQGSATFTVGWWGQDFESGIGTFNVDVADNGGAWVRWLQTAPINVVPPAASGSFTFFGVPGHSYAFRVQAVDKAGNASAYSPVSSTTISSSAPAPEPFSAAYAVARTGDVSALSSVPIGGPLWGADMVRGFVTRPGGGGYLLDLYGGLHALGNAPTISNGPYWPGWDIARGAALNPDGKGGYVLDGFGGLHPFGTATNIASGGYWPNWDIARDVILTSTSTAAHPAGYVMDEWGGLHPFGGAPTITNGPYWPGWKIAKDAIANPTGPGGWILDGWGGMHPFGGAPNLALSGYWTGWDIARGAAMWNSTTGLKGYAIDGWGGLHPINNAPNLTATRYWPGQDLAKYIDVSP